MNKVSISIVAMAVLTHTGLGECDCTIVPFPRACLKECMGRLVSTANYKQLTISLGLSPTTSRKIVNVPERHKLKSIDAYAKVLNNQELSTVKEKISQADKETVASIVTAPHIARNAKKKESPLH